MIEVQSVRRQPLLSVVCVLLSAHFAIAYNTLTAAMVPFHHYKNMEGDGGPFAYRMLPALLWKIAVVILSPLHRRFPRLHMPYLNRPFTSQEDWFVVILTFASMLGTLIVARRLLRSIDSHWGFEWMALGMGYAAYFDTMLVLNRNLYYPYDVAALFFFTLLVYLAYRNRAIAFTLVLIPAFVNKETAAMAIFIFFGLQYGRYSLPRLISLCGGMGALVVAIRLAQRVYIHHICSSCGEMTQNQFSENVRQMFNPLFWLSESAVFGFAYVGLFLFWRFVPVRVRVTSIAVFALWGAAMLAAGVLREVRIFSELSAVVLLVIGSGVHGWLRERRPEASRHEKSVLPMTEMAHG
jgi:uncharacterized membrane protein